METWLDRLPSGWKRLVSLHMILKRYVVVSWVDMIYSEWLISCQFCQGFSIFTTCFMLVSVESVHSAYICSIIIARPEAWGFWFSSVLVLLRAWAIWGTRRRVTNIFAWSYVGYIVVLMASSVHGLYTGNSRSLCTVFIFICKNGFASVVHFQFLKVAQVCVATGPSRWLLFGSCSILILCYFKEYVVGRFYIVSCILTDVSSALMIL